MNKTMELAVEQAHRQFGEPNRDDAARAAVRDAERDAIITLIAEEHFQNPVVASAVRALQRRIAANEHRSKP